MLETLRATSNIRSGRSWRHLYKGGEKLRVRAFFRPTINLGHLGTSLQVVEGDLRGDWLHVTCPVTSDTPLGKVMIHLGGRVVIVPTEAEAVKAK